MHMPALQCLRVCPIQANQTQADPRPESQSNVLASLILVRATCEGHLPAAGILHLAEAQDHGSEILAEGYPSAATS
jgi:hypothetical protein